MVDTNLCDIIYEANTNRLNKLINEWGWDQYRHLAVVYRRWE